MNRLSAAVRTRHLIKNELFQRNTGCLTRTEQIEIEFLRARAVARAYNISAEDIITLSDNFWAVQMDNIIALDGAPSVLVTIQYNLAAGTLIPWAVRRPELQPIVDRILNFDCSAQFMLTEHAHGLDAMHIETIATLLEDGSFDLHTPHDGAAKYMPPTVPLSGLKIARVAIVLAKLVVNGEDRGIRPFFVPLSNENEMCEGVICRQLPERVGTGSLGHALTWFNHVHLPPSYCLGSTSMPRSKKAAFHTAIWRVVVGGLAVSLPIIPALGTAAYIASRYSQRRMVISSSTGKPVPIISFRTQQIPILHALAQQFVIASFMQRATSPVFSTFCDANADVRVRMGIAAAAKCAILQHGQESLTQLSDRLGAQGLVDYNQIISLQLEARGSSIAEGDTLVLSIRLATELILGRYDLPAPRYPDSLAAKHEAGLLAEARHIVSTSFQGQHRNDSFNRILLPRCETIVRAIGERIFYEAALDAGLDNEIVDLYEVGILKHDPAWYATNCRLNSWDINEREDSAVTAALPMLERWLSLSHTAEYAVAPIVTAEGWQNFVGTLTTFSGHAKKEHPPLNRL